MVLYQGLFKQAFNWSEGSQQSGAGKNSETGQFIQPTAGAEDRLPYSSFGLISRWRILVRAVNGKSENSDIILFDLFLTLSWDAESSNLKRVFQRVKRFKILDTCRDSHLDMVKNREVRIGELKDVILAEDSI